eukprot:scpid108491/ scgid2261/ 
MGMLESDRCYHFVFLHPYPFPGPPSALANLQLLENGMDKVKLLWSVTRDAYPATQLIFLWTLGGGADVGNATRNITEHSGEQTLDNLVPQTAYIVSVYTVNTFGESEVARELSFHTHGPPSPLTDLQLTRNGTDTVSLFWRVDMTDGFPATQLMFVL